jgi:hypothetical protein
MLASALWHAAHGWRVGPCEIGGKRPVVPRGFKGFSNDRLTILSWFEGSYAGHNVAVATGAPGPDVCDVDVRADGNGWVAFDRLKQAGLLAGAHRLVGTPSGGLHIYFVGTGQRCGSLKDLHIDFKSQGGCILVPPSQVGDRRYEILDDRPPTGATVDWSAAVCLLRPPRPIPVRLNRYRCGPGSGRHLVRWLEGETEGNRNSGLFWSACRALELGDKEILTELADVALCAGLNEDEVRGTIASAYRTVGRGE